MKKKISILLTDLRGGGAERVVINLANEFVARGYSVDIVLKAARGEFIELLDKSITVVSLKSSRLLFTIYPLFRYLRSAKPDALIANMWPLTVIAVVARFLSRVPARLMLVEHTTWSQSELLVDFFIRWQVRTSMRLLFRTADAVVTVSKGAADDLSVFAALPPARITPIYNPIVHKIQRATVTTEMLPISKSWHVGNHKKILAVGTLKNVKDFETLLSAFSLLRKKIDSKLLILGDGNLRATLENQIIRLNLSDSVTMPGFVQDPKPYYKSADLFVLSSIAEGFGNVIVEALSAGTPVVSTDCPSGPSEILDNGNYGILAPVGDAQALADAMTQSLSSIHDKDALRARSLEFTVEKSADAYLNLLFPSQSKQAV